MSVKITNPLNVDQLKLGETVVFKGTATEDIVKVELVADERFQLGQVKAINGRWSISYPFNRAGKRRIIAKGFDAANQQVASDAIDIFLVGSRKHELGIDVSIFQGNDIDWQAVKNADISFAFVKATEGATWVDDTFAINWQRMKQAGIIRGAYHFFRPLKTPQEQVDNFLTTVKNVLEPGDLPPVLDVEPFPDNVRAQWEALNLNQRIDRVEQWLQLVERETGSKPIIYTNPSFWHEFMDDTQVFTNYPLWIAHYTNAPQPFVPARNWGGNGYTIWQYTQTGTVPGVSGNVDRNRFNGSFEKLVALANVTSASDSLAA
jgi:GH25 family lysozyme M1 (1,4-beta-N-acetylmuramidase)